MQMVEVLNELKIDAACVGNMFLIDLLTIIICHTTLYELQKNQSLSIKNYLLIFHSVSLVLVPCVLDKYNNWGWNQIGINRLK